MSQHLLIDGYNVLKRRPEFSKALDRSLEDGRLALIRFIRECAPQKSVRNSVTVIFDGQPGMGGMDLSLTCASDVRVVFSQGASADDLMRQMVEESEYPAKMVCVTDDRELSIICRHRGANVLGVDSFMDAGCKRERKSLVRPGKKHGHPEDGKKISESMAGRINRELERRWLHK